MWFTLTCLWIVKRTLRLNNTRKKHPFSFRLIFLLNDELHSMKVIVQYFQPLNSTLSFLLISVRNSMLLTSPYNFIPGIPRTFFHCPLNASFQCKPHFTDTRLLWTVALCLSRRKALIFSLTIVRLMRSPVNTDN